MECYLDNAATTRPYDSVRKIMEETMEEAFGNPSSLHQKGVEAEEYVENARKQIAKSLKAEPKEIVFTSGGTESNNQAVIGTALARKRAGMHLVSTCFEHASVYNPMEFLSEMGFEVSYVPVDGEGHVKEDELLAAVRPDTILVSIMLVNNEIGAVQNVERLSKLVKEKNPDVLFHVDAIQGYGKVPVCPKRQGIDLLSVSGHKIHGPKGSGFLYIKNGVRIRPIIYGGEQQKNMRSGTENVPAIAGMGQAVTRMWTGEAERIERMYRLKEHFIKRVLEQIPECQVHGLPPWTAASMTQTEADSRVQAKADGVTQMETASMTLTEAVRTQAPHIISVGFAGVRSEVLLHALEERGIYVSSGSACSSNHPALSGTLKAIGVDKVYLDSTLRFSLGAFTTEEELDYTVDVLAELVPVLRKYRRS